MDVRMILAKVEPGRLQRAVEGLENGTFQVYLSRQDDYLTHGLVTVGADREHTVIIGEDFMACDCADFLYRRVACKHIVAMAVQLQRAAGTLPAADPPPVNLKLVKTRPGWQACP